MSVSLLDTTLGMAVRMSTPYLFAALGGLLAQRSGVYNFALEGMMLGGAYFGYFFTLLTGNLLLGILGAILFGLLSGWLLAFISIRFGVSQMVVGLGMNTLYMGLTSFCSRLLSNSRDGSALNLDRLIGNVIGGPASEIPIIGSVICSQNFMTYLIIALFVFYAWFTKRTEYGLSLRAVGENPAASQTAGINVFRYRYLAVIVSGALASLGGAYLTLTQVSRFSENMTNGRGWIAIAAICLGRWSPSGTFLSCLLFGLASALSNQIQVLNIGIPYQFALMVPYILAILALVSIQGKSSHGPAALGKPYMKNR